MVLFWFIVMHFFVCLFGLWGCFSFGDFGGGLVFFSQYSCYHIVMCKTQHSINSHNYLEVLDCKVKHLRQFMLTEDLFLNLAR